MAGRRGSEMAERLTFLSLFAGIGGFELGFERAGMACEQQVEIDDNCNVVLAYHWPDVQRLEDVRDVGRCNLKSVDLVCGGFPCQDVSVAGRREGLDGERSGLWFEFIRVVEELEPKWVVVENVTGLLSSNDKRDFATVLSGLGQRGYWWAYRVLNAEYWRVPHRRRRVFVVGCLARGRAQEVLFERESSPWDTPPGRKERAQVAIPLTQVAFDRYNGTVSDVCPTLPSSYEGGFNHVMVGIRRLTPLECERLQGFPDGWTAVNGMSDSPRYRMLGNAVCVPVAEWLGRRIVMVERGEI